jgi:transcriptional regulatory protein RtcR
MTRQRVAFSMLGTVLDGSRGAKRWRRWRPTVDLCRHDELPFDRLELLYQAEWAQLAETVLADVREVSPGIEARGHPVELPDPWDFEQVFATLFDFARGYAFKPQAEDYLIHMTTGTHVVQICLFLLTESRHLPGKLIQTSPPQQRRSGDVGSYAVIDLDLARYDPIATRFAAAQRDDLTFLKAGIETRNAAFNRLIERIEQVAGVTTAPILITGPTGAGKSQLARRIYELKRKRNLVAGERVEVNCATLRGDQAMSTLFGHVKGAFTGASRDRPGLLRQADQGLLFLDEVGELGLDEQAMLLRALEEKTFLPVGADREVRSEFQLLAGTNRDLQAMVREGTFREDLLARLDLWAFPLPPLRERLEDLEPNLDYELELAGQRLRRRVSMTREARRRFLAFGTSPAATWSANFRDLTAAVTRMATLAPAGRIGAAQVDEEAARLERSWAGGAPAAGQALERHLSPRAIAALDLFDRAQLEAVLAVCERASSLSAAGRELFAVSRTRKRSSNDADRLRKYLAKHGLSWSRLNG